MLQQEENFHKNALCRYELMWDSSFSAAWSWYQRRKQIIREVVR